MTFPRTPAKARACAHGGPPRIFPAPGTHRDARGFRTTLSCSGLISVGGARRSARASSGYTQALQSTPERARSDAFHLASPIFGLPHLPRSSRRRTRHNHTETAVMIAIRGRVVVAIRGGEVVLVVVERAPANDTARLTPEPLHPGGSHQQAGFTAGTNRFFHRTFFPKKISLCSAGAEQTVKG